MEWTVHADHPDLHVDPSADASLAGTDGMSAWMDREVWMQSEQGWPRIINGDTPPKAKQREECPHISEAALRRVRHERSEL